MCARTRWDRECERYYGAKNALCEKNAIVCPCAIRCLSISAYNTIIPLSCRQRIKLRQRGKEKQQAEVTPPHPLTFVTHLSGSPKLSTLVDWPMANRNEQQKMASGRERTKKANPKSETERKNPENLKIRIRNRSPKLVENPKENPRIRSTLVTLSSCSLLPILHFSTPPHHSDRHLKELAQAALANSIQQIRSNQRILVPSFCSLRFSFYSDHFLFFLSLSPLHTRSYPSRFPFHSELSYFFPIFILALTRE